MYSAWVCPAITAHCREHKNLLAQTLVKYVTQLEKSAGVAFVAAWLLQVGAAFVAAIYWQ